MFEAFVCAAVFFRGNDSLTSVVKYSTASFAAIEHLRIIAEIVRVIACK